MIYLNKKLSLILTEKLFYVGVKELPASIYGTYWYGNEVKREVTDLPSYCIEDFISPLLSEAISPLVGKTSEVTARMFADAYYENGWKGINRIMVKILDIKLKYCWTCKYQQIALNQITGVCTKINKEIPAHIVDKGCEFWKQKENNNARTITTNECTNQCGN